MIFVPFLLAAISIRSTLAAPLSVLPPPALEAQDEVQPGWNTPRGHPYIVNHHAHLNRRQLLDVAELGLDVATNPIVDHYVGEGIEKAKDFFEGEFGSHSPPPPSTPPPPSAPTAPTAPKSAPKSSTKKSMSKPASKSSDKKSTSGSKLPKKTTTHATVAHKDGNGASEHKTGVHNSDSKSRKEATTHPSASHKHSAHNSVEKGDKKSLDHHGSTHKSSPKLTVKHQSHSDAGKKEAARKPSAHQAALKSDKIRAAHTEHKDANRKDFAKKDAGHKSSGAKGNEGAKKDLQKVAAKSGKKADSSHAAAPKEAAPNASCSKKHH